MSRPSVQEPPSAPVVLSDASAPDFLESHEVVVLTFLAEDDAPSARFRPRLELVAAKLGRAGLGVGILVTTHDRLIADAMGIEGIPSTVVFVRGEMTDRLLGAVPETILEETIRLRLPGES